MKNNTLYKHAAMVFIALIFCASYIFAQNATLNGTVNNTGEIKIKGALSGSFSATVGTNTFDGTVDFTSATAGQAIPSYTYTTLQAEGAGKALSGDVAVKTSLSTTVAVDVSGHNLTLTGATPVSIGAGGSLVANGSGSTVTYNNNTNGVTQPILGIVYDNLSMSGKAKSIDASTTVNNQLSASSDVTISATGTLALATTASDVTFNGAFTDNGTFTGQTSGLYGVVFNGAFSDGGTFTAPAGSGAVTFSGSSAQTISVTGSVTTIGFKNLTISGTGDVTASAANLTVSGAMNVSNENLVLGTSNSLEMTGTTQPSYTGLVEVKGNMIWDVPIASTSTYKFNNSATKATFNNPTAALKFSLNSQPATPPAAYVPGHTVNRTYTVTTSTDFASLSAIYLAYNATEVTGGVTEARLKDFNNPPTTTKLSNSERLKGTYTRTYPASSSAFGVVELSSITSTLTSGNQLILDDRYSTFTSIASTDWRTPSTWGETSDYPLQSDEVTIASGTNVPITHVENAHLVTIADGGTLTLSDGASSLTIGSGGLTIGDASGLAANLNLSSGNSIVINNNGNLTNNATGVITNAGTITVGQ